MLLLVGLVAGGAYFLRPSVLFSITPKCVFELSAEPKFLSEDVAMTKARDTLDRAGLDAKTWQPMASGDTTAPDGRRDLFLKRSSENPNAGHIIFTKGSNVRVANIELVGKRVTCYTYVPRS